MLIFVLGAGCCGSDVPFTLALVSVVVANAEPFPPLTAACALVETVPATMRPESTFPAWTVDELLAMGPVNLIDPDDVSVIAPVVATPGMVTPEVLTVRWPPVQLIPTGAHGPVATKPDPAVSKAYSPYEGALTDARMMVRTKLLSA